MAKNSVHTSILLDGYPWKNNSNEIWLASTLKILRNIDKFNFPGKINTDKQKAIIPLVSEALVNCPTLDTPLLIRAEDIDPLSKELLSEHFLSETGFYQAHTGEAFILDKTARFLATINIEDHLHLVLMQTQGELEAGWNKLGKIESCVGKSIKYAFSQRFGYLTANPVLCGTGFQATTYLQLPTLIHSEKIDDILEEAADESIMITGLQGSPTEIVGDILAIRNNYTLGVNEEQILKTIHSVSTKLLLEETNLRTQIKAKGDNEIKDRVSRAFGILNHSYQIEAVEALNALSLIKLGIVFGWISGISNAEINELFFNCRRAHLLLHQNGQSPSKEELPHIRAEFIRKALKHVKLKT